MGANVNSNINSNLKNLYPNFYLFAEFKISRKKMTSDMITIEKDFELKAEPEIFSELIA